MGLPAPVSFAEEIRIQEESKALLEAGLRFPGLHGIGGVMPPAIASIAEIRAGSAGSQNFVQKNEHILCFIGKVHDPGNQDEVIADVGNGIVGQAAIRLPDIDIIDHPDAPIGQNEEGEDVLLADCLMALPIILMEIIHYNQAMASLRVKIKKISAALDNGLEYTSTVPVVLLEGKVLTLSITDISSIFMLSDDGHDTFNLVRPPPLVGTLAYHEMAVETARPHPTQSQLLYDGSITLMVETRSKTLELMRLRAFLMRAMHPDQLGYFFSDQLRESDTAITAKAMIVDIANSVTSPSFANGLRDQFQRVVETVIFKSDVNFDNFINGRIEVTAVLDPLSTKCYNLSMLRQAHVTGNSWFTVIHICDTLVVMVRCCFNVEVGTSMDPFVARVRELSSMELLQRYPSDMVLFWIGFALQKVFKAGSLTDAATNAMFNIRLRTRPSHEIILRQMVKSLSIYLKSSFLNQQQGRWSTVKSDEIAANEESEKSNKKRTAAATASKEPKAPRVNAPPASASNPTGASSVSSTPFGPIELQLCGTHVAAKLGLSDKKLGFSNRDSCTRPNCHMVHIQDNILKQMTKDRVLGLIDESPNATSRYMGNLKKLVSRDMP